MASFASNSIVRRQRRRRFLPVLTLVFVAAAAAAAQQSPSARIAVLASSQPIYAGATDALASQLRQAGFECLVATLPDGDDAARRAVLDRVESFKPSLVATAGTAVTTTVTGALPEIPTLFFMVPNAPDVSPAGDGAAPGACLGGVSSDPSPAHQMDWIRRSGPNCQRIAILHSDRCLKTVQALEDAAQHADLTIVRVAAAKDRFRDGLDSLAKSGCDGVLMIPDAQVYNAPNVQQLLLWGIRNKKPVWAFSENVVKAGAFAGQHADAANVGRTAATLIEQVARSPRPAYVGVRYADAPSRSVNMRTAEIIGADAGALQTDAQITPLGEQP